jgi:hypothetical protein
VRGDIATSAPVRFFYGATRSTLFPQFGRVGITFNRDVYTVFPQALGMEDPSFIPLVRHILLHELTHVEQYRAVGYDLSDFGVNYLFHLCEAGGWYNNNQLEEEAVANEDQADSLLTFTGDQFFQLWSSRHLGGQGVGLGFPIAKTFISDTDVLFGPIMELEFQFGLMQIISQTSFRTFSAAEAATKAMTECTHLPPCRSLVRRMPPEGLPPRTGGPDVS